MDEDAIALTVRTMKTIVNGVSLNRSHDAGSNCRMFQIQAVRPGDDYVTCLAVVVQGGTQAGPLKWLELYDKLAADLEVQFDKRRKPEE